MEVKEFSREKLIQLAENKINLTIIKNYSPIPDITDLIPVLFMLEHTSNPNGYWGMTYYNKEHWFNGELRKEILPDLLKLTALFSAKNFIRQKLQSNLNNYDSISNNEINTFLENIESDFINIYNKSYNGKELIPSENLDSQRLTLSGRLNSHATRVIQYIMGTRNPIGAHLTPGNKKQESAFKLVTQQTQNGMIDIFNANDRQSILNAYYKNRNAMYQIEVSNTPVWMDEQNNSLIYNTKTLHYRYKNTLLKSFEFDSEQNEQTLFTLRVKGINNTDNFAVTRMICSDPSILWEFPESPTNLDNNIKEISVKWTQSYSPPETSWLVFIARNSNGPTRLLVKVQTTEL